MAFEQVRFEVAATKLGPDAVEGRLLSSGSASSVIDRPNPAISGFDVLFMRHSHTDKSFARMHQFSSEQEWWQWDHGGRRLDPDGRLIAEREGRLLLSQLVSPPCHVALSSSAIRALETAQIVFEAARVHPYEITSSDVDYTVGINSTGAKHLVSAAPAHAPLRAYLRDVHDRNFCVNYARMVHAELEVIARRCSAGGSTQRRTLLAFGHSTVLEVRVGQLRPAQSK